MIHIARVQALGDEVRITAYQLLKLLGKANSGQNRTDLNKRLSELNATALEIKSGGKSYEGSLIEKVYRDEHSGEYVIVLDAKIRILFERDMFTQFDLSVRQTLQGHPLAQWLHGFYASHAKPYPIKVETLHRLCGSETANLKDYRAKLRKALGAVSSAFESIGKVFNAEIRDDDMVYVEKTPNDTQRRHLSKPKK